MMQRKPPLTRGRAGSRFRFLHLFLMAELLYTACFVAPRVTILWHHRWVQDDAYVSFRYARNLVTGNGLVYNVGERVEGYSNFLWTILSAVPLALGEEDPLFNMHILGLWLWVCSYALLIALGVRLFRDGHWSAPLAPLPLAVHWSYNMWFVSGMETPLVSFLTIVLLVLFTQDPERHPRALCWTSLAGVALTMARPDGVVIFGGVALAGLALYWRQLLQERQRRVYLWQPLLPVLLVWLPYNLWRVLYFGDFFPNTYYAKVGYLSYYSRGWLYLRTYLGVYPFALFGPFAVLGVVVAPSGTVRRFLWGTMVATAAVFFYVVRLGGDFMEWRFVTPITGVLYPAIVIGAGLCGERIYALVRAWRAHRGTDRGFPGGAPVTGLRLAGFVLGVSVAVACTLATAARTELAKDRIVPGQENIALLSRYCDPKIFDWGAVGRTYHEVLPPHLRIATTSAGIIPYFSGHQTLDLNGMTDPIIARRPIDPANRGRMGHEKWVSDFDEMRRRGVDVFLYWADPKDVALSLIHPPRDGFEMVSMRLPDGRYTEFAILSRERIDMAALRRDPRLVFYGTVPLADRHQLYALREKLKDYEVIDRIDLEQAESHSAHELQELYAPGDPEGHNWHEKLLLYRRPLQQVLVHDNGFIPYGLRWTIRGASARRNLTMVLRTDQIGGAIFDVSVNGNSLPQKLKLPSGPEAWEEVAFVVPARFLAEDSNEFIITRAAESKAASELYYMWFLQRPPGLMQEPNAKATVGSGRWIPYALRERLQDKELVDEIDLEEPDSEAAHELAALPPPGQVATHDWHVKTLSYRLPLTDVVLTDNGVIPYGLVWRVDNVSGEKNLIMVVRHDRTGGGIYRVEVNGRKAPGELEFTGGPEAWDEIAITIPREYLRDGGNDFRLVPAERSRRLSELYYMWFFQ